MNDTVATQTGSTARPVPREQPNLGRLSLPQGSLGYEGKTQMQTYDMSDGRRVPGFENIQRNNSSYFGLSLRMPTVNVAIVLRHPLRRRGLLAVDVRQPRRQLIPRSRLGCRRFRA